MTGPRRVAVVREPDVAAARRLAREVAHAVGLGTSRAEALATAVSEIARNIVVHSRGGEISVRAIEADGGRRGVEVVARDGAPGIADVDQAMRDGYSTKGSLGLGLPGARRLVDEFEIVSVLGAGTTVTLKKWRDETRD